MKFESRAPYHSRLNVIQWTAAVLTLIIALCIPRQVLAGTPIKRIGINGMGCNYLLEGRLETGHTKQVSQFIDKFRYVEPIICLNSSGGSLQEGIELAKFFRENGVPTRVLAGHICLSACAVAFMGGTENVEGSPLDRAIDIKARLGFHAPSLTVANGRYGKDTVNEAYRVAVSGIADLINAADGMEMPLAAIETMLKTAPEDFYDISTVGRSIEWGVEVRGLQEPPRVTGAMWLTACLNFVGNFRAVGPFPPADEQSVVVYEAEQRAEVSVNVGNVNLHRCKFEVFQKASQGGLLGWVTVSDRNETENRIYKFSSASLFPWHSELSGLDGPVSNTRWNQQIMRLVPRIPCSVTKDGLQFVERCRLTETVSFKAIPPNNIDEERYRVLSHLQIDIPDRSTSSIGSDNGGRFSWDDYLPTPWGIIYCTGQAVKFDKLCIAEDAEETFVRKIIGECMRHAAAPFQSKEFSGVPIWAIKHSAAKTACERAVLFDDSVRNATTALARILYSSGDHQSALQLYLLAAEEQNATAQNGVGIGYLYGKGVAPNVEEAQLWFDRAMALEHPFAFLHAGAIAEHGMNGESSTKKAIELYEQAAMIGASGGLVRIGNIHRRNNNLVEAAHHYQRAVDVGDTEAMIILANLKMEGNLPAGQDLASAAILLRDAAERSDRNAAYALAVALSTGDIPKDAVPEAAQTYLLQAATLGHVDALVDYARFALEIPDKVLAEEFLARAKDLGNRQAATLLDQLQ